MAQTSTTAAGTPANSVPAPQVAASEPARAVEPSSTPKPVDGTPGNDVAASTPAPSADVAAPTPAGEAPQPPADPPPVATPTPPPPPAVAAPATPSAKPEAPHTSPPSAHESWFSGTGRLTEPYYEAGFSYGFNGPLAAEGMVDNVGLTSVRVLENYGYLARLTMGTLIALGQSDRKYVGSTYGYNYRVDYYRSLTSEERAAQQAELDDALSSNYIMELSVYAPGFLGTHSGRPQGRGFEYYLGGTMSLGMLNDLPSVLQLAFTMSHLAVSNMPFKEGTGPHSDAYAAGSGNHAETVYYSNLGAMVRLILPVNRLVEGYAQWDLNVLSLFDTSGKKLKSDGYLWTSPLRIGALVNATDRFYVRAHGSLNGFGSYGLGGAAEAGVRF